MDYLRRSIDSELDELLPVAPALAIDGPKGVGKTCTARRRADVTWSLDDPSQREIARADFALSSLSPGTALLDEWQKLPQIWDSVRRHVDDGAPAGRFLLTGSAAPVDPSGTSGAGRILSLRMRPMGLHERGVVDQTVSFSGLLKGQVAVQGNTEFALPDYAFEIVRSGFPGIMQAPDRLRAGLLSAYLQRVIDRDLPDQGYAVRRPETLRRWLAAYAAASSSTASYSRILDSTTGGDGTQPAKTTTIAYREHLTQLWLLDPVPGWIPANNAIRRLQQAPKHQLADPALAARLLDLSASALLGPVGAHMAGPLFESLVTLGVRVLAQTEQATVSHLRVDSGAHEIDLIVQGIDGQILAIEVKLAGQVDAADVRHLHWLRDQMPDRIADLVVITTGTTAYRRPDGIAVVPLALLGP
ncbi:ATP-binding protein [Corynebacterium variabile]|uniref:ATP-binding protein n=1 Tax=Corynebacterium variabile TaxID=1727 RepID=UPI003BAE2FA9